MWKKIAIGGAVAAAVIGVGTASLAVTGDPSTTPGSGSTTSAQANAPKPGEHGRLRHALGRNVLHGQIVTQNPRTKQIVTHDVIRGTVTAVSATSITVRAADNTSFTYTVDSTTKVVTRTAGQRGSAKKAAIGDVKVGDKVAVTGTGTTSPYAAKHIVDGVA